MSSKAPHCVLLRAECYSSWAPAERATPPPAEAVKTILYVLHTLVQACVDLLKAKRQLHEKAASVEQDIGARRALLGKALCLLQHLTSFPHPPSKPLLGAGAPLVYPGPPTTHAYRRRLFFSLAPTMMSTAVSNLPTLLLVNKSKWWLKLQRGDTTLTLLRTS